jgi:hypothetical protein
MAVHYIQMSIGDKLGEAATGTSLSYSSGYGADLTLSWESSNVTTKSQILDAVHRIIHYMDSYQDDIPGSTVHSDQPCGWRTKIAHDSAYGDAHGVDFRTGASDTNSILETSGDVALEADLAGQNITRNQYVELAHMLKDALSQTDYPLA